MGYQHPMASCGQAARFERATMNSLSALQLSGTCFLQGGTPPIVFMPSKKELRDMFNYEPETGKLFLKKKATKYDWRKIGVEVGRYDRRGYRVAFINFKAFRVHNIIWNMNFGPIPKGMLIDHQDHNPSNNRLENLRSIPEADNYRNKTRDKRNTSGCAGVGFCTKKRDAKKWRAILSKKHIGYFENFADAVAARKAAERLYGYHPNHGA